MVQRLEEAYRVLGVPADSDLEHVAEAYRRLARATHPDVNADPDAAARFAALAAAYRLVSGRTPDPPPPPTPSDPATATSPAGPPSGSVGAPPLGTASPYLRAGPGRPPIVAGPVSVRRRGREARRG